MELIGCNFIPFLSVWLGWTEVPTIYLCVPTNFKQ
jgi:hypothetical protein